MKVGRRKINRLEEGGVEEEGKVERLREGK